MSCGCALGETSSWWQLSAGSEEIFVWRCQFSGASIATADDALAIVHGAAQAKHNQLDIRGITVAPSGSGLSVDIIFNTKQWLANPQAIYAWPSAKEVAAAIAADPGVIARFPQFTMNGFAWLQLTGPASAIDFWRAQAIIWDRQLGDQSIGGPTQAFADRVGAYIGKADDGSSLQPLPGSGKVPIGPQPNGKSSTTTALWVLGGLGAIAAVWYFSSRSK